MDAFHLTALGLLGLYALYIAMRAFPVATGKDRAFPYVVRGLAGATFVASVINIISALLVG